MYHIMGVLILRSLVIRRAYYSSLRRLTINKNLWVGTLFASVYSLRLDIQHLPGLSISE